MGNCLQRTIHKTSIEGRLVFPKRKEGRRKIINDHILYDYDSFVISCFVVCSSGPRPSPHDIQSHHHPHHQQKALDSEKE